MPQKDGFSQRVLLIVFLILHSHTLSCQHLGYQIHFVQIGGFWLFFAFTKQVKHRMESGVREASILDIHATNMLSIRQTTNGLTKIVLYSLKLRVEILQMLHIP